ncbi:aspartate/glutamate racemase family protein [Pseudobacteriovorax antillogorgiicola]|uniref:Aspartate racemase n=1 Tax=Pseudobacteriovorax antillogorgiicola TaxID=1513793 RepID=A0A1Y6BDL4_9BACT|nr:amino acid racemase [Pseudobacteriovorax antillogorgiicola]TCS58512.1 aspartate racemase [Pseudobacteriovorax antillogorgiicola]SME98106.1 aspartate racemase [Pseudobacteriovorax antillogorgiicola]
MLPILGIIGGVSYHSTIHYYKRINEAYGKAKGGHSSAPIMIDSLDFSIVERCRLAGKWQELANSVLSAALRLERVGCQAIMVASNTLHKFAPLLESRLGIPLLHIGDGIAFELNQRQKQKVLLLGTKLTMDEPFLRQRVESKFEGSILCPDPEEKLELSRIIYEELTQGMIKESSKAFYEAICSKYQELGVDGILMSCTEIGLLIPADEDRFLDSLEAHVSAGVEFLLVSE